MEGLTVDRLTVAQRVPSRLSDRALDGPGMYPAGGLCNGHGDRPGGLAGRPGREARPGDPPNWEANVFMTGPPVGDCVRG